MKKRIIMIVIAAWLLIPTGTPDDVITFFLIKKLGPQIYALLLIGVVIALWHYHITFKKIKQIMKGLFKNG